MDHSEKLGLAVSDVESESEGTGAVAVAWDPWRRRGMIAMALAVGIAAFAIAVGMRVWKRLEQMEAGVLSRADSVVSRVDELSRVNSGLHEEVLALRSALASTVSEDVLFLKVIMLKSSIDPELARTVARLVHTYALRYNKDPNLVLAIISVESDFNPNAVSKVGATGLMQVMPHWKKVLGIDRELTDPETSIHYGLEVLGFYEQIYKDPEMVLTAYNRGPGPVDSALMRGASPENGYSAKVLATYERLRRLNTRASLK